MNVCFLGAGSMAEEHIKAFRSIPNVILAGIHSRTIPKAQYLAEKYSISKVYTTIEEMYTASQATLLIIAVSELSVKEVCLLAFKYPWVCLVEKPAGINLAEAEIIEHEARKNKRKVFVALNRRQFSSTFSVINDLANSKEQRLIHVYDQENPKAASALGRPELVVQNWMYANSIHLIDYFAFLGRGEIISVEPIIRWNPLNPMFVASKIIFSSGDIGIYEAVWNAPGPWGVTVTTRSKRWELRPLEKAAFQVYGSRQLEYFEVSQWDINFKPGFRAQADEAIKAVKGLKHNLANIEVALETMRLVNKIYA